MSLSQTQIERASRQLVEAARGGDRSRVSDEQVSEIVRRQVRLATKQLEGKHE